MNSHSSTTAQTQSSSRARFIAAVLLIIALGLTARLFHIQYVIGSQLSEWRTRQQIYVEKIPARPGTLVDRHGRMLAGTMKQKSLFCVPKQIENPRKFSKDLAGLLSLNVKEMSQRIKSHSDRSFLWLKRRLDSDVVLKIQSLDLPENSFGFRDEYLRKYPQGNLAAHVLGHRDIDGNPHGGLEEAVDQRLRGVNGQRTLMRDALGRVISINAHKTKAAQHGPVVSLTLDVVIQTILENSLSEVMEKWNPEGACGIVMDPKTGEILALASHPNYDPNNPVSEDPRIWNNLALGAQFEPGSTFKPFVVAWALQNEVINKESAFHCGYGKYQMGRRLLRDHHPYGNLNVTDILVKSSNIGMAKIGERLTNEKLYEAAVTFGFGGKTGLDLPGELTGLVRELKDWTSYSTGSIPMGQELSATPLQIISATAILANGGAFVQPHLIKQKSKKIQTSVRSQIIDQDIADWLIQEPLRQVVVRGTGKRANIDRYKLFGKTGTAQKYDAKIGKYSHSKLVCSFVAGAPVHDPQLLVIITVDEPKDENPNVLGGGSVAAPAVAKVIEKSLIHRNVSPDLQLVRETINPIR